jgi:rod shape-determining protein MreC
MIQFLAQKRATILFIGISLLMVFLMSHDVGSRGGPDVAAEFLFKAGAPAVKAGSSVTSFAGDLFRNYVDLRSARSENRRLLERLQRTEQERDAMREMAAAGERLQSVLALKKEAPCPGIPARVIGSDIARGGATLLIDRGSSDGVSLGMPVVAVGGVVGRIVRISSGVAKVQTIGDPASGVAVTVQDSGYQGMVVGRLRDVCELIYVPGYADLAHGDLLVTSSLDRIYPRGVPVGRVVGLPEGSGLARRFEVKPGVDFQRLSEVLVLLWKPAEGGEGAR